MVTAVGFAKFLGVTIAVGEQVALKYVIGAIIANLAISALLGKILAPKIPKSSISSKGIQNVVRDNVMPRRIIYGDALVGGPYAVLETVGTNNSILNMVVVLAGHPVEDILGVKIENEYIDISGAGGATNTASNDLDTNYWVEAGKFGSTNVGQNTVRIIKNKGFGYADYSYVTDPTIQDAQDDRARSTLIANALFTEWLPPLASTRDSGTGLYGQGSKLTNCAHIFISLRHDVDVWSGLPKIKVHVRGKRLYNPAYDISKNLSAVSPNNTHDLNDPDTWEWSEDWTLSVLDYLMNTSYGLGAKVSGALTEIDWTEAIQSYLDSSALITNGLPSPDTDVTPRYTTNGVLETSATPISNMEALLTSGSGALVYAQGKYAIRPGIYREPASSTDIINEDMIVSPLSIRTHTPRSEIFNKASGVYVERNYELPITSLNIPKFEPTDFEIVDPLDSSGNNPYEVIDGEEIIKQFDFPFTTRNFEAQRLARIQLERVRRGLTITFEANMQVLKYSVGDTVYLEILSNSKYANEDFFNRLGLDSTVQNRPDSPFTIYYKQFKIVEMQYTENSTIQVSLIEEAEEIYEWNAGMASKDESAIESEIIIDDPYGDVLEPSFVVNSPYNTIEETVGTAAGTTVTTRIRWSAAERGSIVNALDRAYVQYYTLEYGIVDNPSLTEGARVSEWLAAGNKVSDPSQVTQGPMPLETLYKDGSVYDFRVRAVTFSGRRSPWAYYSTDIGSDYNPTAAAAETARTVSLTADDLAFTYNSSGSSPSPTSTTFTATPYGFGSPQYRFLIDTAVQSPGWGTTATYTYTPEADIAQMPEVVTVEAREGASGSAEARDSQSVVGIRPGVDGTGANAYTVILSNEAHTLSTTAGGTVDYTGSGAEIRVFDGTTELTSAAEPIPSPTDGKFSVVVDTINPSASVTPGSITTSGTPAVIADHSSMTEDTAVITYAINIEDTATIYKDQSLAKSIAGSDGTDGIVVYLDLNAGFAISAADGTNYGLPPNPVSQFKIFDGTTDITDTSAVTYSVVAPASKSGLTIAIDNDIGEKGEITLSGGNWVSDSETFIVRATYNAINYDLQYSITKTLKGDGLIFYSTNESDTIPADFDGTGYTLPTNPVAQFVLYENGVDITDTSAVTYSVDSPDTKNGLTIAIDNDIGEKGEITLSGASWTSNSETFTMRASYDGLDYVKTYSISKAIEGVTGPTGPAGIDGQVGWGHNLVFSSTDADTVAWTAGSIWEAANPSTGLSINAGNTLNMTARTYIYYDADASPTDDLKLTTDAQTAVGANKILVAVAEDTTSDEAFFQVFGGYGGLKIAADEIAANSIIANNISAGFYEGRTFTGGVFQTRKLLADLDSPLPDTPRASMSLEYQFQLQNENDDVIFSVTEADGLSQVEIVGDVTAAIDSNIFSKIGIDALREQIGVVISGTPTGGIATRSLPTTLTTPASADYELDVNVYITALTTNTLKFTIQDSGFREGSSNNPYTAPTWDLEFFYSDTGLFAGEEVAVPSSSFTITGTANNISDPEIPWYTNTFSLNATRQVTWTPASPFAADDTIYYMIRVDITGGDSVAPKLTALTASEAVVGDEDYVPSTGGTFTGNLTLTGALNTLGDGDQLLLDAGATTRSFISTRTIAGVGTKILSRSTTVDRIQLGSTAFDLDLQYANLLWNGSLTAPYLPTTGGTLTDDLAIEVTSGAYGIDLTSGGFGTLSTFGVVNAGTDNTSYIGSVSNNDFQIRRQGSTKLTATSTGVDVAGNITVTGTVDGIDIGANAAVKNVDQTFTQPQRVQTKVTGTPLWNNYTLSLYAPATVAPGESAVLNFHLGSVDNRNIWLESGETGYLMTDATFKQSGNIVWDAGDFDIADYLPLTGGTLTGDLITSGYIATNQIRCNTSPGNQLVINAGESVSYATGQTAENVYINAEAGLQVNSSPDNWATGWGARHTTTICDANGYSYFPSRTHFGGDTIGYLGTVTGDFGSVQASGAEGSSGTWHGFSIGGRLVFMDNAGTAAANRGGIYDDLNNQWALQFNSSGADREVSLYYQGTERLETTSSGISVTGGIASTEVNSIIDSGGGAKDFIRLRDSTDAIDLVFHYNGSAFEIRSENSGAGNEYMQFNTDGSLTFAGNLTSSGGALFLNELSTGATDVTNHGQIYTRNTSPQELWFVSDDGVEHHVSGGSLSETFGAVKPDAEDITSSSTLQNDDDLAISVTNAETYMFTLTATVQRLSGTDPGFKWDFTVPSGTTGAYQWTLIPTGGTTADGATSALTTAQSVTTTGVGTTGRNILHITGTFTAGADGTIQWRWAQNTSNIQTVTVLGGSGMMLIR